MLLIKNKMVLRIKNFNILGGLLKNTTFRGEGVSQKTNIEEGVPKNRGLGQFADLRGGLGRK